MELLVIAALIGLIPAVIASNKGRSFGLWWFFGFMLFIVALPAALIIKSDDDTVISRGEKKKCAFCAELIRTEAVVCRFCGRAVAENVFPPQGY